MSSSPQFLNAPIGVQQTGGFVFQELVDQDLKITDGEPVQQVLATPEGAMIFTPPS